MLVAAGLFFVAAHTKDKEQEVFSVCLPMETITRFSEGRSLSAFYPVLADFEAAQLVKSYAETAVFNFLSSPETEFLLTYTAHHDFLDLYCISFSSGDTFTFFEGRKLSAYDILRKPADPQLPITVLENGILLGEDFLSYEAQGDFFLPSFLQLVSPSRRVKKADAYPPVVAEKTDVQAVPEGKYIALTFDDGPAPKSTSLILDALQKYGAHGTFFVMGSRVEPYAETLRRTVAEGHEIGNHTFNHVDLRKKSEAEIAEELSKTDEAVFLASGIYPTFFRPPFGARTKALPTQVGLPMILWSVDTTDWRQQDPSVIYKKALEQISPGDIILFHDMHMPTARAMDDILQELTNRGYTCVTLSQLFEIYGIAPEVGAVYRNVTPVIASKPAESEPSFSEFLFEALE